MRVDKEALKKRIKRAKSANMAYIYNDKWIDYLNICNVVDETNELIDTAAELGLHLQRLPKPKKPF